jgi:hypothetical protein
MTGFRFLAASVMAGVALGACGGSDEPKVATVTVKATTTMVTLPPSATVVTPAPAIVVPEVESPATSTIATPATTASPTTTAGAPTRTSFVDATAMVKAAVGGELAGATPETFAQKAAADLRKALAARAGGESAAVRVGWTSTGNPVGVVLVATGTGLPGVSQREFHLKVAKTATGLSVTSAAVVDVCAAPRVRENACR